MLLIRALVLLSVVGILIVLYRLVSFRKQCPGCGYADPNRIPRKGIAKRLPVKAYACPRCHNHFYKIREVTQASSNATLV
ncbi:hypothetical protein [Spirosoma oryzicola]|uniref:hypothetical protein n=1 Tax=Spirosoma oryzicola TaxID=2898794 RepID=UPI001E4DE338|nr:hypothetical protein [Spirosoma oryzicola]UHG89058.1 hypothetical protein LQ777_12465 [Spirosoma oryzicola]